MSLLTYIHRSLLTYIHKSPLTYITFLWIYVSHQPSRARQAHNAYIYVFFDIYSQVSFHIYTWVSFDIHYLSFDLCIAPAKSSEASTQRQAAVAEIPPNLHARDANAMPPLTRKRGGKGARAAMKAMHAMVCMRIYVCVCVCMYMYM